MKQKARKNNNKMKQKARKQKKLNYNDFSFLELVPRPRLIICLSKTGRKFQRLQNQVYHNIKSDEAYKPECLSKIIKMDEGVMVWGCFNP
uniref:Uncharacterized protein n=1 Tax=Romanomermis culicivorax TaxID=13658 RepID=A0A915HKM8_ROMCU